jgi:hypothetical protein
MSTVASVLYNLNYFTLDTTVSPNAYILNRIRDLAFQAQNVFYDPFYQVGTSVLPITSPVSVIQVAMILNLSTTEAVNVFVTPNGGSQQNSGTVLQTASASGLVGGFFLYMNPIASPSVGPAGGLSAISVNSGAAGIPCEVLLAG